MAGTNRIEQALRRAVLDAREPVSARADGVARTVHVAIGDAQAPLATFLAILDAHGLLGDAGRLLPSVHLTSIGDHFDYGPTAWRRWSTEEGLQLLSWLAAHPADQVCLIMGNHDSARVGELATLDSNSYLAAREDADGAYNRGERVAALQQAFLARWPQFPDSEIVARDFSSFSVQQRGLVTLLLREGRLRLAHAHGELLLVHAGVTTAELDLIGAPHGPAPAIAEALGRFLDGAVQRWSHGPLSLAPLYRPGSRASGEARGMLAHRPAHPERGLREQFEGPMRRRYDPRQLPEGITQVIGHIRDGKCVDLLGEWAEGEPAGDGPLRELIVQGDRVQYRAGTSRSARLLFIDGGMNYAPVEQYQLLDLDTLQPRVKLAISGT
ncbi:MAG: metallophosphoesterase [Archangiaceae bacterium]|nr:metallophosphoesterase [Archangiaceae bacterium]